MLIHTMGVATHRISTIHTSEINIESTRPLQYTTNFINAKFKILFKATIIKFLHLIFIQNLTLSTYLY